MRSQLNNQQSGFTLLEVIISLSLLATMSYFISTATSAALKNKSKIQKDLDENSNFDNALSVMIRDIRLAFNHRDLNIKLYNESMQERIKTCEKNIKKPAKPLADGKTPPPPVGGKSTTRAECDKMKASFKVKTDPLLSQFQGDSNQLHFTSTSNIRMSKDSQQSQQAEISYFLKSCNSRGRDKTSSECIWRRNSPLIDDDIEKGGRSSPLLEKVKKLSFRYLYKAEDKEEPEWRDDWKSREGSDAITKDKFPLAVEISLTMTSYKGKKRDISKTVIAPISFVNNADKKEAAANASTSKKP